MLRRPDPVAQLGQPVVAATLVIQRRIGSLIGFFDQALVEHPLDRAIQRARPHPNNSAAQLADIPHDRVTVLLAIGERHDNVHDRRRQRQEPIDLSTISHPDTMSTLAVLCQ